MKIFDVPRGLKEQIWFFNEFAVKFHFVDKKVLKNWNKKVTLI